MPRLAAIEPRHPKLMPCDTTSSTAGPGARQSMVSTMTNRIQPCQLIAVPRSLPPPWFRLRPCRVEASPYSPTGRRPGGSPFSVRALQYVRLAIACLVYGGFTIGYLRFFRRPHGLPREMKIVALVTGAVTWLQLALIASHAARWPSFIVALLL